MKKIKPLGNRVLVERYKAEKKQGGIILPETAAEKPQQGEVIAVGPGKINKDGSVQEMSVKVKDSVLFSSYAGTEVKIDNQDYLIMTEEDILGILSQGE